MKKIVLSILMISGCLLSTLAQNKKSILQQKLLKKETKNDSFFSINRGTVSRPMKSNNFYWDGSSWINVDSTFYEYSSGGNLMKETHKENGALSAISNYVYDQNNNRVGTEYIYYNSDTITGGYKYARLVDSYGNLTETKSELWNTNSKSWEIFIGTKFIRTYDSNNLNTETIRQVFNDTLLAYVNASKSVLSFDSKKNVILEETFNWDGTQWILEGKSDYVYNSNNELITLTWYVWENNNYVPEEKVTDIVWEVYSTNWINDNNAKIKSYLSYIWDGANWAQDFRYTATFDTFGSIVYLEEKYKNGAWENSYRGSSLFDSNRNETEYKTEEWKNNKWEITSQTKNFYTYDSNNNMLQKIVQLWDVVSESLINDRRYDYSDFKTFNTSGLAEYTTSKILVYPNPFTNEFLVELENANMNHTFTLTDLSGKQLLTTEVKGSAKFDVESLNSGYYIYSIISDNKLIETGKLLKL